MQERVQLKLRALSQIIGQEEIGIITLSDAAESSQIAVICDANVRDALKMRMEKKKECNNMLPETLWKILGQQYGFHGEIIINDIIDGEYKAMLVNTDSYQPLSMRASDAILLHVFSQMPIYATSALMKRQSVPLVKGSPLMALPYNALSEDMLRHSMKAAIDVEKYEVASAIRDELKRRGVM